MWLRNNASTLVSQLIDTVLFIMLAFSIIPGLHGGSVLPLNIVALIIAGQYLLKVAVALMDTPFVYLGVLLVNKYMGLSSLQSPTGLGGCEEDRVGCSASSNITINWVGV